MNDWKQLPDLDPGRGGHRAPEAHAAPLKAPFTWAGGKSKVADLVWERLGNVDNYVEPFAGSLAVLLRRPADHFAGGYRVETCNDADGFICNFWRAVRADPDKVAEYADWPVLEADLHARHKWLMRSEFSKQWREKMVTDPDHFDAKIAGWWCWGLCCWIGSGWCSGGTDWQQTTLLSAAGQGVNDSSADRHSRPQLTDAFDLGRGVNGGAGELSRASDVCNVRCSATRLRGSVGTYLLLGCGLPAPPTPAVHG